MYKHIHIFGASGSGTTTIAKKISERMGYSHFDSDDYFWLNTKEPFTEERDKNQCMDLMKNDLESKKEWILSGSLTGWGEELLPFFDMVVFVHVPSDIRIERLKNREVERYGDRIRIGGDRYKASNEFIEWASKYDLGTGTGRNIFVHQKFLEKINCKVVRIENIDIDESVERVIEEIKG